MSCCPTEEKYGYEGCRFESDVDENFHCSICYNVLKEPRMCTKNEHVFCLACITQYLNVNSQTCPECSEHLSADTLRRAPRALNNYLSKLRINCDYANRGCPQFTSVEELKNHVANCGFSPVLCSKEECSMVIDKKDRIHHETVLCEYRKFKYYGCEQTQEDVKAMKRSLMELDGEVKAAKQTKLENNHVDMEKFLGKLEGSLVELDGKVEVANEKIENNNLEMKQIVGRLEGRLVELDGKVEAANQKTENNNFEMEKIVRRLEESLIELDGKVETMNKRHDEIKQEAKKEVEEVRKEVRDVKENLCKMDKDVDEVKVMVSQMLEKINVLERMNKLSSPTDELLNNLKEDILVAGGYCLSVKTGKSTEIYSWEKNGWFEAARMNDEHIGASLISYKGKLFVFGGDGNKKIETLDLNELPLKWNKFCGELPYKCDDHQTVVYQQRVIHIGGYISGKSRRSNVISELELTSPCAMKDLCQMPEPRDCHGAEILEDKVLILGGQKSHYCKHAMDSVLEFDATKNECKELSPLPHPLTELATVRWLDQVIVLGGRDKNGQVLNDVFMYDCKTGKIIVLPSMLEKRYECCSVITGNTIVVMGGINEEDEYLNSAECFTMGGSTWEYLPAMNKARYRAVADVLPSTRKYV
ncbi:E3 ubiquitin- ligase NRDP1-like [Paramuricea clavata]|uniref:E3 ubiquitin- ligase NRDP1-like n=1 Tax=Paramuricea clavata TaxID=317549 RepID=A0A6S7K671_PARCT|nr:E3 ubiquitin- ligase NRDP1-like [Paramuricea clavata]